MAETIRSYPVEGNEQRTVYPVNFTLGYLDREHIYVYHGTPTDYASISNAIPFTWNGNTEIVLGVNPEDLPVGVDEFYIRRVTPRDTLINDYENGALMIEENLDDSYAQGLMIIQELEDGFQNPDEPVSIQGELNMNGYKIINLGDPVGASDAVNKAITDALDYRLQSLENNLVFQPISSVTYDAAATAGQTSFTLPTTFGGNILIYVNGLFQSRQAGHYAVSGNVVTLDEPRSAGDRFFAVIGEPLDSVLPPEIVEPTEGRFFIPANAFRPSRTSGSTVGFVGHAGTIVDRVAQIFTEGAVRSAQCQFQAPYNITETDVLVTLFFTSPTSGNAVIVFNNTNQAEGTMTQTWDYSTSGVVAITNTDVSTIQFAGRILPRGGDTDQILVEVKRDATHGNDTIIDDVQFLGMTISWTLEVAA